MKKFDSSLAHPLYAGFMVYCWPTPGKECVSSMMNQANQGSVPGIGRSMLLASLAGLLQACSLPNFLFTGYSSLHSILAFLSFVPYIYTWRRTGWRGAFGYGWIMGFIYFTGTLTWIRLVGRNTNIDNAVAWLFFAVCGGIYFGLFGMSARLVKDRLRWPDVLILPAAFVAWEYLRGHILTGGWPWGSLGTTQYGNLLTRQLAAVAGVGGLSFLILAGNILLTDILENIFRLRRSGGPFLWHALLPDFRLSWRKKPVVAGVAAALALLWLFIVLQTSGEALAFARQPRQEISLALLQGNINTRLKWDRRYRSAAMSRMTTLHQEAAGHTPDLIVWAESCFPGILEYPPVMEWEDQLRDLIRSSGIPTVLTSNEYEKEQDLDKPPAWHHYNSAFYLGSQGQTLGRYRKIHLVPFGEYIPYEFLKRYLQTVVQQPIPVDFEPGDDYSVFSLGDVRFSVLICYEDMFEELGHRLARAGADFFLVVANNSWSGRSAMSYQHTAMSVFLAIEHRAFVARADMTGPTGLLDPWGNIYDTLPYFKEGVKMETIYPAPFKTFFTRFGNLIPFLFLLYFFGLCLSLFFKPKKH